jgi:hypothetical protein
MKTFSKKQFQTFIDYKDRPYFRTQMLLDLMISNNITMGDDYIQISPIQSIPNEYSSLCYICERLLYLSDLKWGNSEATVYCCVWDLLRGADEVFKIGLSSNEVARNML